MNIENSNQEEKSGTVYKLLMPLDMEWQPKEDITTHELALCMPYLVRHTLVMPYEVDTNDKHLRHFKITYHN